jgi:hypothetical protein
LRSNSSHFFMSVRSLTAQNAHASLIDLNFCAHQVRDCVASLSATSLRIERSAIPRSTMPPYKQTASSPAASAESTSRKRGRPAKQDGATPKNSLLAGPSKRKASAALSDTSTSSQKMPKTTHPRGRPKTNTSSQSGRQAAVTEYDDKPYTVVCPAKPVKKNETSASSWRGKDGAQFGLEAEYAIKPTQRGVPQWGDMRSYSSMKCES